MRSRYVYSMEYRSYVGDARCLLFAKRHIVASLCGVATFVIAVTAGDAANTTELDRARDQGVAWLLLHQHGDGSWGSTAGTEFAATAAGAEALAASSLKSRPY